MPKKKKKQQGGKLNLKKLGRKYKSITRPLYNSFKPYLKETAEAGIVALGASASVAQPELAPYIIPATLGLSAFAGQVIDDPSIILGKSKRNQYISKQISNQYSNEQPFISQPAVPPNYVYQSPMMSVPSHYGYGLYAENGKGLYAENGKGLYAHNDGAYGEGLFAGGSLLSRNGQLHPALISSNPNHLRNKHLSIYSIENTYPYL